MLIIGCDYHPGFQQIAVVDTVSGELGERRLAHREDAEQFYRKLREQGLRVRVGMEASGHSRWFERLPCGRNTRGLLERRHVQIGRKIPIRKESNRRWEGGNDPSILNGYDLDQPDSTATEYVRLDDNRKHKTHAVASSQLREWLGLIPLDLVSYHTAIDRHTLRSVRDGKPARKEALATLMELKKLWMNAVQSRAMESARETIRLSRRDYTDGGGLRQLMLPRRTRTASQ